MRETVDLYYQSISLPIYSKMSDAEIASVVAAVEDVVRLRDGQAQRISSRSPCEQKYANQGPKHVKRKKAKGQTTRMIENPIVILSPFYPPAFRVGPSRTLAALVRAAPETMNLVVVAGDRDLGTRLPVESNRWTTTEGVECYYVSSDRWWKLVQAWTAIARQRPTALYLNGFFPRAFTIWPLVLHRLGWCRDARILLAPRGEFSPGSRDKAGTEARIYQAEPAPRTFARSNVACILRPRGGRHKESFRATRNDTYSGKRDISS